MTISHLTLNVPSGTASRLLPFYTQLLAPLGYRVDIGPIKSMGHWTGFAPLASTQTHLASHITRGSTEKPPDAPGFPDFWIRELPASHPVSEDAKYYQSTHVAFDAATEQAVRSFFEEGLKAGGRSNGEPGTREELSRQPYYAAYVIDEVGNNIEAVCLSGVA